MIQKRVFSGVQPTGNLHLGNYLGAIKNFVDLQNKFSCIYCIVDLHAITNRQDPKKLKSNILEITASFIASGLEPEKNIIFNQASIAEHSELA
jgi:tryptophanyl-tRNA synthetase